MILVGATAVGVWHVQNEVGDQGRFPLFEGFHPFLLWMFAEEWARLLWPSLVCWTVALLVIRLRSPRPRRLFARPGMVACSTVVLILLVEAIWLPMLLWVMARHGVGDELPMIVMRCYSNGVPILGLGVIVAWSTLLVNRRWCPEPSGIDRLGRVVGCLWIAATLATLMDFMNPMI